MSLKAELVYFFILNLSLVSASLYGGDRVVQLSTHGHPTGALMENSLTIKNSNTTPTDRVICMCMCCFMGSCRSLPGAWWPVTHCGACKSDKCKEVVRGRPLRDKMAETFKRIAEGKPPSPEKKVDVDVCTVISVLEASACPQGQERYCRSYTDVRVECYSKEEPLHKYAIWTFLIITVVGIVFGFAKNNIPALRGLNERLF